LPFLILWSLRLSIGTRRVSSWKAGCTCTLNLHATDPAQLEFRSVYISATEPQNVGIEDTPQDDATSADDSELQFPMQRRKSNALRDSGTTKHLHSETLALRDARTLRPLHSEALAFRDTGNARHSHHETIALRDTCIPRHSHSKTLAFRDTRTPRYSHPET